MKGHPQLENGYTQIANELLGALMKVYLSNYERRIIDCIIRYTYGFHKKKTKLALTFISKATGIALPNVSRTKKKLLKKNMVIQTDNNELSLQKRYKEWVVQTNKLSKQTSKVVQTDKKRLSKQRGNKYNIKKTLKDNIGLKKKSPTVRKSIKFPKDWYERCIKHYQAIRSEELSGSEYKPIQQALKTMFMNGRKPGDIMEFMSWLEYSDQSWTNHWTINTVRLKISEYLAGRLQKAAERDKFPERLIENLKKYNSIQGSDDRSVRLKMAYGERLNEFSAEVVKRAEKYLQELN